MNFKKQIFIINVFILPKVCTETVSKFKFKFKKGYTYLYSETMLIGTFGSD